MDTIIARLLLEHGAQRLRSYVESYSRTLYESLKRDGESKRPQQKSENATTGPTHPQGHTTITAQGLATKSSKIFAGSLENESLKRKTEEVWKPNLEEGLVEIQEPAVELEKRESKVNPENKGEDEGGSANILRIIKNMNKNAVIEDVIVPIINPIQENKDVKEIVDEREVHRRLVGEKHKELLENGIEPASLLTKANLEKWIKSGKSYMKIAKETGVDEGEVSRKARGFGLSSAASKYKFYKKAKRLL
jgi:hypothetical protein